MKRFTCLLFLVLLVTTIFADGVMPEGTGSIASPYQIATLDNLLWLSTNEEIWSDGLYYEQTADIDASETEFWNDGAGYFPIGYGISFDFTSYFSGSYDGGGYTISSLYINRPATDYAGLFGYILNGYIHDIHLENSYVNTTSGGALLASGSEVYISNCTATGTVNGKWYIAGLVGTISDAIISNCSYEGEVNFTTEIGWLFQGNAGGLICTAYESTISDSYSNAIINGGNRVGGLVGFANAETSIEDCTVLGEVTGIDFVGGLVGILEDSTTVENCNLEVNVNGVSDVGGLVGKASSACNIKKSCNIGNIEGGVRTGGLVGYLDSSELNACYINGNVSGTNQVGGLVGMADNVGSVLNCYSRGDILGGISVGANIGRCYDDLNYNYCYHIGNIEITDDDFDGLIGHDIYVTDTSTCFWNTDATDYEDNDDDPSALTDDEFRISQIFINAGWDFIGETVNGYDNVWYRHDQLNNGYPFLTYQEVGTPNSEDGVTAKINKMYNYPNPFNPETTISFNIDRNEVAKLNIYNLKGQLVKSLGQYRTGQHSVVWNGEDEKGCKVSSGIYLYHLKGKKLNQINKMILTK
jgi:hypothetical protein